MHDSESIGEKRPPVLMRSTTPAATPQTDTQAGTPVRSILQMQRACGNRYVQRMIQRARAESESHVSADVEQTIQTARGSGQALDNGVRDQMEPALGADFGGVRVHTDGRADGLNRDLNARAFTTGQDIFFRQGEYSPGSSGGRELLAHELTHVVQQNGKQVQTKLALGAPGDRFEQEADSVARAISQQPDDKAGRASVQRQMGAEEEQEEPLQAMSVDGALQRQVEEDKEEEPVQAKAANAETRSRHSHTHHGIDSIYHMLPPA